MILDVKNLTKHFTVERGIFKRETGIIKAVDGLSFNLEEYRTLGIVGESGSGKTTLSKLILGLIQPDSGEIIFDRKIYSDFRKNVQIIFQNPYNSLDPKMKIIDLLKEPMIIHKNVNNKDMVPRIKELLKMVGLEANALDRYPIEFSGGQRQRICIARALICQPRIIVLDEPISSLDLTVQAQIMNLFATLKEKLALTYIFISHNLAVIKKISDQVIVMQSGKIVEQGSAAQIFNQPANPYTQSLLKAVTGH